MKKRKKKMKKTMEKNLMMKRNKKNRRKKNKKRKKRARRPRLNPAKNKYLPTHQQFQLWPVRLKTTKTGKTSKKTSNKTESSCSLIIATYL